MTARRQPAARPPLAQLPPAERRQLLDDLNYLNPTEIKRFCKGHSIPYRITIEAAGGVRRGTRDDDRKGIVLARIREFLATGRVPEATCFPAAVVCFDPLPEALAAADRLHYGQYDKTSREMVALLKDLTGGQFRNGAIARILANEFWRNGTAPTFAEYASAWLEAVRGHKRPNPEWAFLSDRAAQGAVPGWKALRTKRAARAIKLLHRICG